MMARQPSQQMIDALPISLRDRPVAQKIAQACGWRIAVPLLQARARRRLSRLQPGAATIVTVNWNSWPHLDVLIDVVRRRSPGGTRIIAVANGSRDESRARLDERPDVKALKLPLNLGHELAMDLGVLQVETEFVVALDVDAFPLHEDWLERLLAPLSEGAQVSGARLN